MTKIKFAKCFTRRSWFCLDTGNSSMKQQPNMPQLGGIIIQSPAITENSPSSSKWKYLHFASVNKEFFSKHFQARKGQRIYPLKIKPCDIQYFWQFLRLRKRSNKNKTKNPKIKMPFALIKCSSRLYIHEPSPGWLIQIQWTSALCAIIWL